jgi:hypothetical protein
MKAAAAADAADAAARRSAGDAAVDALHNVLHAGRARTKVGATGEEGDTTADGATDRCV